MAGTMLSQNQSVSLGSGYANDVFYSMENGVVGTASGADWDIALTAESMNVAVRINGGHGVKLYDLQSTLADWATADTAGKMSSQYFNDEHDWSVGAFNQGATGGMNYGWGDYNTSTHNVEGSRVFAMTWSDGTLKKVAIESMSAGGNWTVRVSDLADSTWSTLTASKSSYSGKKFLYMNLRQDSVLDREPAASTYDLIFGKYIAQLGGGMTYPVTGVRTKSGVFSAKVAGVDTLNVDVTANPLNDTSAVTIGYDWKSFSMSTFSWALADSTAYLIQPDVASPIYQVVFKSFDGSSTGNLTFSQRIVSALSQEEWVSAPRFMAYPTPSMGQLTVASELSGELSICSMSGLTVHRQNIVSGVNEIVGLQGLPVGTYIIQAQLSDGSSHVTRWQCL